MIDSFIDSFIDFSKQIENKVFLRFQKLKRKTKPLYPSYKAAKNSENSKIRKPSLKECQTTTTTTKLLMALDSRVLYHLNNLN